MSCATCDLCGTSLGPESWTTLCGGDCVDRFMASGRAAANPVASSQLTLPSFRRTPELATRPTHMTLDAFAAQA